MQPSPNEKPIAKQFRDVKVRVGEDFIENQRAIVDQFSFIKDPYSYLKEGHISVQTLMKQQEQPPINFPLHTSQNGKQSYIKSAQKPRPIARPKSSINRGERTPAKAAQEMLLAANAPYKDSSITIR